MRKLKQQSMQWKPHAYQLKAVKYIIEKKKACLLLSPGSGKTSICLEAVSRLLKAKKVKKILVIAPLSVCYDVWPTEVISWKEQFGHLRVEVFHGRDPAEMQNTDAQLCVVNFDYLVKLFKTYGGVQMSAEKFKSTYGFDALIVDELSAFKNIQSKRYKMMKTVTDTFEYCWGLTGSPVANRFVDLFGQMFIVDGGDTFGRYVTHFRNEYFRSTGYGGYTYVIRDDRAFKAFTKRLSRRAMRLDASDYLTMPDLIRNDIVVDLPMAARKSYDELHKELVTYVDGTLVDASSVAVMFNKCRQLASGSIYTYSEDNTRDVQFVHTAKYDALKTLVDELQGEQLLVGYNFQHEALQLKKLFPRAGFVHGGTPPAERSAYIKRWNDGDLELLCAHPESLGHGVNLQKGGNHICWLTMPWDGELYDQFQCRIYRQGAKAKKVFVHHIMARNTVDYAVKRLVSSKLSGQQALFDALKNK